MHETLKKFREVWESILSTGIYNIEVENLALNLATCKDLNIRNEKDLQFYTFALIFARFVLASRNKKEPHNNDNK